MTKSNSTEMPGFMQDLFDPELASFIRGFQDLPEPAPPEPKKKKAPVWPSIEIRGEIRE